MKINKITTVILIIVFLVSGIAVVGNSERSDDSLQISQADSNKRPKMYVLVNSTVYDPLKDELDTYKEDVESIRGLDVEIYNNTYSTPKQVRNFLIDGYEKDNLVGTFFVGNLPYAEYQLNLGEGFNDCFPIDHYYTDLDDTWDDKNGDGYLDEHEGRPSELRPEIWFGRICMETEWEDEVALYENYFQKIHKYRIGELRLPHKALQYVDDDWVNWTEEYNQGLEDLYTDLTVINDKATTTADDYGQRLQEGYEWIQIHCHANHSAKRHAFKLNDGPKGSGGNFNSRDLYEGGQKSLFSNIFTCGSANYSVDNYLCGWYTLTDDYGLASIGTTKPGGMLQFKDYYEPLNEGKSIGEAMKEWWISNAEEKRWWFYGITTIGDPTLSPGYLHEAKTNDDYFPHSPIKIDSNEDFHDQAESKGWLGNGTEKDPYIIEGYGIDGTDSGYCIFIGNTTDYFIVRDCYLYDSIGQHGWRYFFESGIQLYKTRNGIIEDNIASNNKYGVFLYEAEKSKIKNNTFAQNSISIFGSNIDHWNTHHIDSSNTVNDKPVYYWKNRTRGMVPSDAGQIILANCTGVTIEDQELSIVSTSIVLGFSNKNTIYNNTASSNIIHGIYLIESDNNIVMNNTVTSNNFIGIYTVNSNSNKIQNNIMSNNDYGTYIVSSSNNIIANNTISSKLIGIEIYNASDNNKIANNEVYSNYEGGIILRESCRNNLIKRNNITSEDEGIYLWKSDSNTIVENTVFKSSYGIYLDSADNNVIYRNNLIDNENQAYDFSFDNQWFNFDLQEGNYWSDYRGNDSDADGIGDSPYDKIKTTDFYGDSKDEYPLIEPYQVGKNDTPDKPSDPHPKDGAVDVDLYPVLSVNISDPDSDKLNVTFYDADDETVWFEATGVDIEKLHGRIETMPLESLKEETTYRWYVEVSDGETTIKSNVWSFTTKKRDDTESPTADAGSDKTVKVGEEFTLDGSGSSDNEKIVSYEWDLGDGETKSGKEIIYSYDKAGKYDVTLTVTDEAENTDTDTITITVEKKDEKGIPGFNILLLMISISLVLLHSYRKNKR
ncbi:MAG: NosD domain-containing protein [Thermoplasmatota archaeon]